MRGRKFNHQDYQRMWITLKRAKEREAKVKELVRKLWLLLICAKEKKGGEKND